MSGNPGRGDVCWADLGEPKGSRPAKRRPVLVIQAGPYNASKLSTTLVAVITSNTGLAAMPGNVFLPAVVACRLSTTADCDGTLHLRAKGKGNG